LVQGEKERQACGERRCGVRPVGKDSARGARARATLEQTRSGWIREIVEQTRSGWIREIVELTRSSWIREFFSLKRRSWIREKSGIRRSSCGEAAVADVAFLEVAMARSQLGRDLIELQL
jgi:hypothetical protein